MGDGSENNIKKSTSVASVSMRYDRKWMREPYLLASLSKAMATWIRLLKEISIRVIEASATPKQTTDEEINNENQSHC